MSLLQSIKQALDQARLNKDATAQSLLSTLYAEAERPGKNAKAEGQWAPRESSDAEVVAVVKSFLVNAQEMLEARKSRGQDITKELREIRILEAFVPTQLEGDALSKAIDAVIATFPEQSMKIMGQVMAKMKEAYPGQFDGSAASALVKQKLSK